jgi:predicted outer membrane repeat protein
MKRFCFAAFPLLSLLIAALDAGAATLVVTSPADNGTGSLRATVAAAANGDTVTFDPALTGQTITLTSGEIAIKRALTINGLGASNLTISGNHFSRIFNINAVSSISDLTLANGQTTSSGGALVFSAPLTLARDVFTGNQASVSGGAAASRFGAAFAISDCTFSKNTSGLLGGAIYSDGQNNSIVRSTFTENTVLNGGMAGGIFNDGSLSITRSLISNNMTVGEGGVAGGIYSDGTVSLIMARSA